MTKNSVRTASPATRPQGRPALAEGEPSAYVGVRMTANQKAKLQRLGGAAWIRDRIEKARE